MDHQPKKRKKKLLQAFPQIHRQDADMDGYVICSEGKNESY
jgi:hypothetical protein